MEEEKKQGKNRIKELQESTADVLYVVVDEIIVSTLPEFYLLSRFSAFFIFLFFNYY